MDGEAPKMATEDETVKKVLFRKALAMADGSIARENVIFLIRCKREFPFRIFNISSLRQILGRYHICQIRPHEDVVVWDCEIVCNCVGMILQGDTVLSLLGVRQKHYILARLVSNWGALTPSALNTSEGAFVEVTSLLNPT